MLTKLPALVDSNIITVSTSKNDSTLKQFYKIDEHVIVEDYGFFDKKDILVDARGKKTIYEKRKNLMGTTITTSYVILNNSSIKHLRDLKHKNVDTISKMNYVIVNEMLDILNVSRKEIFRNTWGYKDPKTNTWNGIVGDLIEKTSEIGGKQSENV